VALHISRIEVNNFRNFSHLVLDPFPPSAVIVGENGVGKTNLIEALRLVLDPALSDSRRLLREEDIWEGIDGGLQSRVTVSVIIELQGYDDDDDAKAILSKCTVGVSPFTARLTYRFSPCTDITPGDGGDSLQETPRPLTSRDYDFIVFGGDNESTDIRSIRRDVALRVLPALRDVETDLQYWRRNPLRDLLERLPLDSVNLKATADAVATAVDQLTKDPNVGKLEAHLSTRLTAMLGPRLAVMPTLGFASSKPEELIRSVRLFVDSSRRRGISDTSLGSANVIYLGLLLEALAQQRLDDLFVATVVAVEEPEAHLHVSLQRQLFSYLLRSEASLILTTHSPHIAAVAPLSSFVVLRATNNGTIGQTTAGLPLTSEQSTDMERYIDVSRAEILFASAVILVEGLGELYVMPSIAKAAGFDLDSYGVVVASVHGTDFKPYTTLLGSSGLSTPYVVITDGDATVDERGITEAGLRRGIRLVSEAGVSRRLQDAVKVLPEWGDARYQRQRDAVVRELETFDIFVGPQTLETDLCALFPGEIMQAFEELNSSVKAREFVRNGIENEGRIPPDRDARADMMARISARSKGRFAQRLADHITEVDLRARVAEVAGCDNPRQLPAQALRGLGASSHLLLALDRISTMVRGTALFPDLNDAYDHDEAVHQGSHEPGH
jgi:putative ATP-dependent endonuclease of OLD family